MRKRDGRTQLNTQAVSPDRTEARGGRRAPFGSPMWPLFQLKRVGVVPCGDPVAQGTISPTTSDDGEARRGRPLWRPGGPGNDLAHDGSPQGTTPTRAEEPIEEPQKGDNPTQEETQAFSLDNHKF